MSTPGGKGHAPRQQRDDDAFRANWEKIFSNKKKEEKSKEEKKDETNNKV